MNPLLKEWNLNNFPAVWEHYALGLCTIQEALKTIEILSKYKKAVEYEFQVKR